MKTPLLMSFALAVTLLVAGCHANKNGSSASSSLDQSRDFSVQWKATLPLQRDAVNELHLRDDHLFIYTQSHRSLVLSSGGGSVITSADVVGALTTLFPPVVLGERIVYPTNTTLEVYNFNGERLRTVHVGSALRSGAAGEKDTVYFGTDAMHGGRLVAFNITRDTDMPQWEILEPGAAIQATPAVSASGIYYGTTDGRVRAVSPDRREIWSLPNGGFQTNGQILADVKADDSGVYFASTDTKLYSLEPATGKVRWIYFAGIPLTQSPIVTAKQVYQPLGGRGIAAIDKINGTYSRKPLWIAPDAVKYLATDDKYVYLLSGRNTIVAHDLQSGEVAAESGKLNFSIFAQNTGSTGVIYAARPDGTVYAIQPVLAGKR